MTRILTSHLVAMMLMFVLAACTTGAEDVVVPGDEATPLSFSAYVGRASRDVATSAEIVTNDALAQVGGFGVFGYSQGTKKYEQYILESSVPNFLVNQQVWHSSQAAASGHKGVDATTADGEWKYEPVKYYDNNPGAFHSFFAYAPYDADVEMVYSNVQAPQVRYAIEKDVDLLWSEPATDQVKPGIDKKFTFTFGHALSKVTFHVAPFIDLVHSDTHPLPATNVIPYGTTIVVRSIHLNGDIPYTGLLSTATGEWTPDIKGQYYDVPGADAASWTGDGTTPVTEYYDVKPSSKLIPCRDVTLEVVYDVITGEGDDRSHITNKAVSSQTFALKRGEAYDFFLDLGLTSVKFTAKVVDWSVDKHEETGWQLIVPVTTVQVPWHYVDGNAEVGLSGKRTKEI